MATQDTEAQFIDIGDLRVGMFIFLDLGWMQHPFALNSFKLSSRDQIDTLIKLGVNRVRWSPEKSDPEPVPEPEQVNGKVGAGGTAARQAVADAVAAEVAALAIERRQRREILNNQRESLEVCERQFDSAARSYRQVIDTVRTQPEVVRVQITEMVGGMLAKMLDQEETTIRLLSENVGERASQHSINVTVISLLLGKTMGLDATALDTLGAGALLHDIGLIALPERLRWLDSQFSSAERRQYQEHVAHGITIGLQMKVSPDQLAIIAQHHELADGRGYPHQFAGEQIAPLARIVALVNLYDNLCNPANPTQAITPHEALALIFAQMKHQFDAKVLMHFIRMMGVYPPGSVIELSDGRIALVVSVNAARPLKPNIIIFEPRIPHEEALVEDLEQSPELGIRRSLKPLQLPKAAFDYLSPRQRICYFFERARSTSENESAP
jgi:putative nucleotidyltransferase with HDIG domain